MTNLTPDGVDISSAPILVVYIQSLGVHIDSILHHISGDSSGICDGLRRSGSQACDTSIKSCLVASNLAKKSLTASVRSTPPPRFDMAIEPLNLPMAFGEPKSVRTEPAPADSPLMVTLFGSPPKLAMFLRTHYIALGPVSSNITDDTHIEASNLVRDAVVSGNISAGNGQEAESSQTVVHLYNDNVLSRSKLSTITT
jgi:hypothetical protein